LLHNVTQTITLLLITLLTKPCLLTASFIKAIRLLFRDVSDTFITLKLFRFKNV